MIDKLTPELIQDAKDLLERIEKTDQLISERLDYIGETVAGSTWMGMYRSRLSKSDDYFWASSSEDEVIEVVFYNSQPSFFILDRDDRFWCLNESIPFRWLFEDFEEELKTGRQKYLDQHLAEKQEEPTIVKTAMAKLTKEELEALKAAIQDEVQ